MPITFIEYKNNKGFSIHETFMQLAYFYIYMELEKPNYKISNKDDLLYSTKFHIDGYSNGTMSLVWNNLNQQDEQIIQQILQNVKSSLENKGAYISVAELQAISTEDEDFKILYSRNPFPTAELIKIIDALIKMLHGTWNSTNYRMDINYQY